MKKNVVGFLLIAGCVAFMANGCAKKELVKSEQPLAPPKATVQAPAVTPPVNQTAPKPPAVKEQNLTEQAAPVATMETIHFDFDSYVLSVEARDTLKKNAEWMMSNANARVQVQGNCDERGSEEYNLALGESRAKAAAKYLETLGVARKNVTI